MSDFPSQIAASITGNTAGATSLVSTGTLQLAGGNSLTLSQSGQSITLSAANHTTHGVSITGNTAGATALVMSGTLTLAGGNSITLSQNGNAITLSGANQTSHAVSITGNTAGATSLVSTGTLVLSGGNDITLSQAGQTIVVSERGPEAASPLILNPGGAAGAYLSSTITSVQPWFFPIWIPGMVTLNTVAFAVTGASSALATNNQAFTTHFGIYSTVNSTSMSLLGSASMAVTLSSASASNQQFDRWLVFTAQSTAAGISTLSRGDYHVGVMNSATNSTQGGIYLQGPPIGGSSTAVGMRGAIGAGANATSIGATAFHLPYLFGVYSATSTALPANVVRSDLTTSNLGASTGMVSPFILPTMVIQS